MQSSGEQKRHREDSDESESPEVKRLGADLLLDMLDDDPGAGNQDLESVIRSLEKEIAYPSPHSKLQHEPSVSAGQPELGYLLEASDDELGLPPTAAASSVDEDVGAAEAAGLGTVAEPEGVGFGQMWGFEDPIESYGGFGLEREMAMVAEEDGLVFDYPEEVASGPYDPSDLLWRPESLPAA
ncbi:uncharacterized protein LOC103996590 [Musa acuminata AAA Group]|uniref:uncharacterized protein LOC103996590 n=1 Tax=Musa acuminata AAA Group TaxID=214697 RepID=UPI0031D4DD96